MTCLSIIVSVCARLSLPQPTAAFGSTDPQVLQMLDLLNEAGNELAGDAPWEALVEQQTFTTTATPAQAAALPADFDRFIPNSFFNRTTVRQVYGPLTSQEWQALQTLPALGTIYLGYRERSGQFLFTPTPPAGQTIAYEYVSAYWAKSALAVAQPAYLADTDLTFLSEELLKASLRWRFLRAKGLDYAEEMATFERLKERAMGRDGGASALNISQAGWTTDRPNLPIGNFPGP